MEYKILPAARRRLIQIWHYTHEKWGEKQADAYIHGIRNAIQHAAQNQGLWRALPQGKMQDVFFIVYEHHYIFFRVLPAERLGIIEILHERMDIPDRLKDSLWREEN